MHLQKSQWEAFIWVSRKASTSFPQTSVADEQNPQCPSQDRQCHILLPRHCTRSERHQRLYAQVMFTSE